ncbi:MAG: MBL fold metallo-hydrolase [Verrucomicrobiia bacterium]
MNEEILITLLVENSVYSRGLKAEHGLAFHLQVGGASMLFDTGQSDLIVHNARILGTDLSRLKAIGLSHGHYDHTGGLPHVLAVAPCAAVFAHPAATKPRFARNSDGTTRQVGMDAATVSSKKPSLSWRENTAPVELLPGIFLTGEIPRETDYEDVGGPFVLDESGTVPDPIADDQALFFRTNEGTVVLLGCAHAGVVNTLRHVLRLTNGKRIHAVLGGMHLVNASPERVNRTMAALRELGVRRLGPAHCTGDLATARMWNEFLQACVPCSVGSRFVFGR